MIQKLVTVVIPVYKINLEDFELQSLKQCFKVLRNYTITFVKPESLDIKSILEGYDGYEVLSFPDHYFKNVLGYNELLLSDFFYSSFLTYKYMLIYQLDAFVFKDELEYWCNKNYDYIGAPWLASTYNDFLSRQINTVLRIFDSKNKKERRKILFKVGNGGFSLRKISSHYAISFENKDYIKELLIDKRGQLNAIEDVFWSLKAKDFDSNFTIPNYQEAVNFAIDRKPKEAFKLISGDLPFGCHGIDKPKVKEFWKSFLKV